MACNLYGAIVLPRFQSACLKVCAMLGINRVNFLPQTFIEKSMGSLRLDNATHQFAANINLTCKKSQELAKPLTTGTFKGMVLFWESFY